MVRGTVYAVCVSEREVGERERERERVREREREREREKDRKKTFASYNTDILHTIQARPAR